MWSLVNAAATLVVDVLLLPVGWLAPGSQAFWLGVPGAVLALLVFKAVSNQAGIERAKDRIKAHLLELWLYRDDLVVSLRAMGALVRQNLAYLGHSLVPLAVMLVPFLLVVVQIESRFAYRELRPGETALLTLTLDEAGPRPSALAPTLDAPEGVAAETPALRIDAERQLVWRLRAGDAGTHRIEIRLDGDALEHTVAAGTNGRGVTPLRYRASDWNVLLYPLETALPPGPVVSVELTYPRGRGAFLGLSTASWIFFGSSLLFGFAFRRPFGVTF